MVLSRALCLYYTFDFKNIPAARRKQALDNQIRLSSPFNDTGHYVRWYGSRAQLWLWDKQALEARLPEAAGCLVIPESCLAEAPVGDERWLNGMSGSEWQRWSGPHLQDSRWQPQAQAGAEAIDLQQETPVQANEPRALAGVALAAVAAGMILLLLGQLGGALSLWQQQQMLINTVSAAAEQTREYSAMREQTLQLRQRWLAREALLAHPGQLNRLHQVVQALPESASFLQRYHAEPGRLQLQLTDEQADPRAYVRELGNIAGIETVRVRPENINNIYTIEARLAPAERSTP